MGILTWEYVIWQTVSVDIKSHELSLVKNIHNYSISCHICMVSDLRHDSVGCDMLIVRTMLPSPEISADHRRAGANAAVTSYVIVSSQILDWQTYMPNPRTQPPNKRPTPRFTSPGKFIFLGLGISPHSLSVFQLLVSC